MRFPNEFVWFAASLLGVGVFVIGAAISEDEDGDKGEDGDKELGVTDITSDGICLSPVEPEILLGKREDSLGGKG